MADETAVAGTYAWPGGDFRANRVVFRALGRSGPCNPRGENI